MKIKMPEGNTPAPSPFIPRKFKTIPAPPGPVDRFPLEQLLKLQRMPVRSYLRDTVCEYGDLLRIKLGNVWVYFINHPDDVREVLQARHRKFVKGFAADLVRDALGYSVFAAEGALHRKQQKLMQPAFRTDALKKYSEMMLECFEHSSIGWPDGAPIELVQEMHCMTMNVATRTLFNMPPSEKQIQVSRALKVLLDGLTDRITTPVGMIKAAFPILPDRRWRTSLRLLDEIIDEIIREHENGKLSDDLLGQLMAATDENGERMSNRQLRDEVLTLFVAGHETTAVALSWAWYEIARDSEIQERLRQEVAEVCGDRTPTFDDVANLRYCRNVFQEALRHYPPIPIFLRQALEDVQIRDYTLPKGSILMIGAYYVHHDPRFYPDPEKFNPDRWTDEFTEGLHKFAYFPFSGGPRVCLGERFAWIEGILALAYFAQRWEFELVPFQEIRPGEKGILRPDREIKMIVRKRAGERSSANPAPEPPSHAEPAKCPFAGH